MSDVDKSSKTEPPTQKKLSDARSRGQFAKAPEIGMTTTLLAGFLVLFFWAPTKSKELMLFTMSIFENLDSIQATQEGFSAALNNSYIAMGLIVASVFMGGLSLGIWFSGAMVLLACASILYSTSNVLRYYRTDQYVAASLTLFASVALLFWYVLQIFISLRD